MLTEPKHPNPGWHYLVGSGVIVIPKVTRHLNGGTLTLLDRFLVRGDKIQWAAVAGEEIVFDIDGETYSTTYTDDSWAAFKLALEHASKKNVH